MKWTESQAVHLERIMRVDSNPSSARYVGMRYYQPYIESAIRQAYADGFRRFCFVPMYPQYCRATTGSSFESAAKTLKSLNGVETSFVKDFHQDPAYIGLLRKYIADNIRADETLLFSAHSIPQTFVDDGDPYVEQVKRTASLAAADRKYLSVSFQSRTGPVQWVGPDTVAETRRLLATKKADLFVVPISFVCDHIETLYEIDIELKGMLRRRRCRAYSPDADVQR